jgi:hypothetical protein
LEEAEFGLEFGGVVWGVELRFEGDAAAFGGDGEPETFRQAGEKDGLVEVGADFEPGLVEAGGRAGWSWSRMTVATASKAGMPDDVRTVLPQRMTPHFSLS